MNIPAPLSKEFALLAALLVAVAWVGYAFAQEVFLNHRLNSQAAELRQQNAITAAQNEGYRRDLLASTAGAAADEDARQHGYARPDERIYVVGKPSARSTAEARAGAGASSGNANGGGTKRMISAKVTIERTDAHGWAQSLKGWFSNFWRR